MDETELYNILTRNARAHRVSSRKLAKPDPTVEDEITRIYSQARSHRNSLVNFYIWYTVGFTLFVFTLISIQAYVRYRLYDPGFELVPQWALNLLVTGMFAQFVGLLTIVTKQVWDFKPFFAHHNKMQTNAHDKQAEHKSGLTIS